MNANQLERAAYLAAHRILMADTGALGSGCPGARRPGSVDMIAGIIKEVFDRGGARLDECTDPPAHNAESGLRVAARHRTGVLLELPRRASSS